MTSYFLDNKPDRNGVRKVRSAFCPDLPDYYDRIYLGDFERIEEAFAKAAHFNAKMKNCTGCQITSLAKSTRVGVGLVG